MTRAPDLEPVLERADDWWRATAWQALTDLANTGRPFDAYDITELGVVDPDHPARWGALFNAAATKGLLQHAGWHRSRRPGRSGGVCSVWVGVPQESEEAA